mmetsp:Transcript_36730/g.81718  ORF Transcript_36730/g.81718 Transcript_36730/m.81718 type:complete len:510 (+) Transcript_36730:154-1683(+)|eukprot:CAMPEP_0202891582 /NCGR_PEP_ID=MMETSP1392-20130828/1605_1 /ASSEMBLY_ACC=CAM_ASM_000868 /TAXON_ID=225041 /ORGANISM="Chlamydomonas chlamydogama, Strain SAG 11-48b" /LENGTH=509 /DNA_ID=CAMNT_0049575379 /DNA_START=86 /DNA_END=1615 /DNA_ORIENTATION=-
MISLELSSRTWGTVLVSLGLVVVTAILWARAKLKSIYHPIPGLPVAPDPHFLLGHVKIYMDWERYAHIWAKLGKMYTLYFPLLGPGVQLNTIDYVEKIIKNRSVVRQFDMTRQVFKEYFGLGLIALEGELWKKHVRVLGPMLSVPRLKTAVPIMVSACNDLTKKWNEEIDPNTSYDVEQDFTAMAMAIIGEFAFGRKFATIKTKASIAAREDSGDELLHHAKVMLEAVENGPLENPLWKFIRGEPASVKRSRKYLANLAKDMISEYRADPQAAERHALGQILKAVETEGIDFSEQELADEMLLILFGGHETTATTMVWFVKCLSKYPEVQAKLREELDGVLGKGVPPTYDDINARLPYLEMCFKELMRLAITAGGISRSITQDVQLDNGVVLPKDSFVSVAVTVIHRSPEYWVDPERLWPERWEEGEGKGQAAHGKPINHGAWLPFGTGHRACFGVRLASLEIKVLLAQLVRSFEFLPNSDPQLDSWEGVQRLTTRAKYPFVRVKPLPK